MYIKEWLPFCAHIEQAMSKQLMTVSPSSEKIKYENDANRLGILNQIYNVRSAEQSPQKRVEELSRNNKDTKKQRS